MTGFRLTSTVDRRKLRAERPQTRQTLRSQVVWFATGARSRSPAPSLETPHAQPATSEWNLSYSTGSPYIPSKEMGAAIWSRHFHNQYALL